VLAGDAVAGEAATGTLRYLLIRPVGRTRLLVAKLVALIAFVLFAIAAVLITSLVTGLTMFGGEPSAGVALPADVTSLSGVTISPAGLVMRLLATVAYIVVTDSALGAAMGALAVLVTSQVLVTLDAATAIRPYLPTRYWLAWIDFFRDPVLWRDIERGIGIQLVFLVVLLGAAWANFMTRDVSD
jgi:ABC-2 type transport system permease protein